MQERVVRKPKPLVGIALIRILSAMILFLISPALIFAQTSTKQGGVEPQISIGVLVPQTGSDAQIGANMRAAVELAMQQINYKAGGYRLVLHWIDEGDDPTTATSNYERAIVADHIQVGFLGWRSDAAVALMPVVARYKIPHLFGVGATEIINEKFKSDEGRFGYWTTKIYPIPGKVSGAYADAITAAAKRGDFKPSSMTVALYAEDTDWGRSVAASMKSSFERNGWRIAVVENFPKDTTDFSALLAKFKSLNVGVVAGTAAVPQAAASLVKQCRTAGLKSLLVVDGLGYTANWYAATGAASDGVLDEQFVFNSPAAKRFVAAFKNSTGFDPSPLAAGLAYDATEFLVKVIEETAREKTSVDGAAIFETVRAKVWTGQLTWSGIMNPEYVYQRSTIPDPVLGEQYFSVPVVQYERGEPNIIWPPQGATRTLSAK